ncbi:Rieske (2Fe-2S) protein [Raineyella sp. W15-4]|uniref:Rieske (2Fe-2S) protein n=1 Tax=Raineyella sp. W15-4 TaxID=3081651 RepID=UPI002952C4AD|nr:Rieske (2Fe-2S) protein [Raineyella sp. W15-4]WOQ18645.1 Rieske (2Fe-2S) protein [Raineyella sp. W15-4]
MALSTFTRRSVLSVTGLAAAAVAGSSFLSSCTNPGQQTGQGSIPTSEIPVGGGIVLTKGKYVITQPTAGQFHAFTNICAHAGCQVARVKDSEIQCDCHGSRYSITDGHPTHGPAVRSLTQYPVEVTGNRLTVEPTPLGGGSASPEASASASATAGA